MADRWSLFSTEEQLSFVGLISNVFWVANSFNETLLISRDDGATFHNETIRKIWGTFFYVSDTYFQHSKNHYSIVDLIGDMGGYTEFLFIILRVVTFWFNSFSLLNKSIRLLYMEKGCDNTI